MIPYTPATSLLTPGRIGQAAWVAALTAHGAADPSRIVSLYYAYAPGLGLNPDLALAQAVVESGWFSSTLWLTRRNPCGLGITGIGVAGRDYGTPQQGIKAHLHHLCCYAYGAATCPVDHATTPDDRHLFHDGNPRLSHMQEPPPGRQWATGPGYVGKILAVANALLLASPAALGATKGATMPRIALASGHHNTSGGDEFEKQQTGPLCAAVAQACRALGMDVRVVQPDDGLGTIAGSLDVVGNTVVKWANAGWVPDIFLECHTEGGGGTGVFAIYPEWDGDTDADVRDKLGPSVARAVGAATGLGVGGLRNGTMSERETGVGRSGFRLGIFRTTAPLAAGTTRLIIEYGAHDKQPDLAIVKAPGFYDKAGRATAEAFAAFLGVSPPPVKVLTEPPPAHPPGFLTAGTPDTFLWPDGEGVVVRRSVRYYNPEANGGKGGYFDREWDNATGYAPWQEVQ